MRATAQSVSVITTILFQDPQATTEHPVYHGATLSSFTSVSMFPHPFVSFSLRTPSRMAESIRHAQASPSRHMVINLLSASQAHLALQFSRPRGLEDPFASVPYFLSPEGIPILRGCLGALSCTLVKSFPLGDTCSTTSQRSDEDVLPSGLDQGGQGSELFLARVLRVESGSSPQSEDFEASTLPLVYYNQKYVTVDPAQSPSPNKRTP